MASTTTTTTTTNPPPPPIASSTDSSTDSSTSSISTNDATTSSTTTTSTPNSPSENKLPSDFKPLNREPSTKTLISSPLTSASEAYDRNHGPIPQLQAETHRITITDTSTLQLLPQSRSLSVTDLASRFELVTATCALQCAGNRRHTMRTKLKEVNGIDWGEGAVMNCAWTGVRVRDVLRDVFGEGVLGLVAGGTAGGGGEKGGQKMHVAFSCRAVPTQDDGWYGSSITLERALDLGADVLLALKQNGEVLTPEHGFPVRVIVPGVAGARSVKWLDGITLQDGECGNFYMQRDYKVLPAEVENVEMAGEWWGRVEPLMEMPVNSVVVADAKVERDSEGLVEVGGYALPGGDGGPVVRVEVRIDDGMWSEAQTLEDGGGKWAWSLWKWKDKVERGRHTFWSRATDRAGHMQECERSTWNLRGIAYNGYGEADIEVVD